MMIVILLLRLVYGHPFQANLFGHDTVLQLTDDMLLIDYCLEIPTSKQQEEYLQYLQSENLPSSKKSQEQFIESQYQKIENAIQIVQNTEVISFLDIVHLPLETRNKGQFIVYCSKFQHQINGKNLQTVQLLNQNRITDMSIFRNQIVLSNDWDILISDMLIYKGEKAIGSKLNKWVLEEELREIRLRTGQKDFFSQLSEQWFLFFHEEEELQTLWDRKKRENWTWLEKWKRGESSLTAFLLLFVASIGAVLFSSKPKKWELSCWGISFVTLFFVDISWGMLASISEIILASVGILVIFRQKLTLYLWGLFVFSLWFHPLMIGLGMFGLSLLISSVNTRKFKKISLCIFLLYFIYFVSIIHELSMLSLN